MARRNSPKRHIAPTAAAPETAKSPVSKETMVWSNAKDPNEARHAQLIVAGMQALEASDIETAKSHFRAVLDQNI